MSSRYYGVHRLPASWVIDTVQFTITVDGIVYGNPKCMGRGRVWQALDAEQRQCIKHTLVFSRSAEWYGHAWQMTCSTQRFPGGESIRFYRMDPDVGL